MRATLETILAATRERVRELKPRAHELERRAAARRPQPFFRALAGDTVGVIAEVKRRSPSAGAIASSLDPVSHALAYAAGGAVAVSVLTDSAHFGGSLEDLERVAEAVPLPVLRKDFILDELQLLEARGAGASAVLLIVRALRPERLRQLSRAARDLSLGTLVEAHDAKELEQALAVEPTAVGINSRDLTTFRVDLGAAMSVLARVPTYIPAVAESGIESRADVERLAAAGADLVLVGSSVARAVEPRASVEALCGVRRTGGKRV